MGENRREILEANSGLILSEAGLEFSFQCFRDSQEWLRIFRNSDLCSWGKKISFFNF